MDEAESATRLSLDGIVGTIARILVRTSLPTPSAGARLSCLIVGTLILSIRLSSRVYLPQTVRMLVSVNDFAWQYSSCCKKFYCYFVPCKKKVFISLLTFKSIMNNVLPPSMVIGL